MSQFVLISTCPDSRSGSSRSRGRRKFWIWRWRTWPKTATRVFLGIEAGVGCKPCLLGGCPQAFIKRGAGGVFSDGATQCMRLAASYFKSCQPQIKMTTAGMETPAAAPASVRFNLKTAVDGHKNAHKAQTREVELRNYSPFR